MVGMLPQLLLAAAAAETTAAKYPVWVPFVRLAVIIGTIGLPFVLGRFVAKSLRMPDYSTKIGLILCSIIASIVILAPKPAWLFLGWPPKLGIDLKGGVILVYAVDLEGRSMSKTGGGTDASADGAGAPAGISGKLTEELAVALGKRINPDGLKEVVIRPFGQQQIEIIIPDVDPLEIEAIKRLVEKAGILEFRIVANSRNHRDVIELAKSQAQDPVYGRSKEVKDSKGKVVGFWARVGREEKPTDGIKLLKVNVWRDTIRDSGTGQILQVPFEVARTFDDRKGAFERYLQDEKISEVDVLMYAADGQDIIGGDLSNVSAGFEGLDPKVDFGLRTADAARRMGMLTQENRPDGEFRSHLGIVLDGQLLSAPAIQGTITDRGQITGRFTQTEVDELVRILRAGQLPAALNKIPVSENQIGSLLGGDMIVKSAWAIAISALAVYIFVIAYYRLAGLIAAVVLTVNILMILALMILIQAPLTLPGLAGLVLTVGMAVDANVLIFERMREEQARGAAMRMVIRNGFDRAFSTILDSNITTVITAVILYVIGTDQVRGFAVTLTLGLIISMFTAVFCARVMFDIIERRRWATTFNMRQIMVTSNYDFMKVWKTFTGLSVAMIVIGLIATFARGKGLFDIDFNGGTAVQPVMKEAVATDNIRKMLDEEFEREPRVQFSLTNIQVASGPNADKYRDKVFKIDTSIKTVKELQDRLFQALKDKDGSSLLATYNVTYDTPRRVEIALGGSRKEPVTDTPAETPEKAPPTAESTSQPDEPEQKPSTEGKDGSSDAPAKSDDEKPAEKPGAPCADDPQEEKPAAKSADEKPADAKPESDKPADSKPADAKPGEEKPAGEKPASEKPAEEKPASEKPANEKPASESEPAAPDTTETPPETPAVGGPTAPARRVRVLMESTLQFESNINAATLRDRITAAADKEGISPPELRLQSENWKDWNENDPSAYGKWTVQLTGSEDEASRILARLQADLSKTPVFLSSSEVGGQVASDTQQRAIAALLASMVGIVLYIWLRFQHVVWGLAAVLALVHDVLVMLAFVSASYWLEPVLGFMMVEEFKINLTMIAAFLTLVGYSINDTIVLFDRLREIRGKSPNLTREMINQAINQTLSRTILTALTVFLVVVILYFFGGESIHGFAFAMVVGTIAGSYSSIYIAAPVLLRLSIPEHSKKPERVAVEK